MPAKQLPDPEYLRQRLRYEPETGKLYWRAHHEMPKHWNSRYAGTEAFTTKDVHGYHRGKIAGKSVLAHRLIWAMQTGFWPLAELDHINGRCADNRMENMREASRTDNNRNRAKPKSNTSGVVGVNWCDRERKWRVQMAGRHISYHKDFAAAVAARREAEKRHPFHPNHGRDTV